VISQTIYKKKELLLGSNKNFISRERQRRNENDPLCCFEWEWRWCTDTAFHYRLEKVKGLCTCRRGYLHLLNINGSL